MHRPENNRRFRDLLLESVGAVSIEMDRLQERRRAAETIQRAWRSGLPTRAATTFPVGLA
jgi:hypothetical protein